ncbi:MAG: Ig-like domain-containing protein, partial [Fuerstiella sp.]|nr:Ig-like domain-containing protein [Fuerstiella sp.]
SQSSNYNANTGAEKAIDGDTTSGYPSSLALTRKELGAWWKVDLDGGFDVETIVVYNRGVAGGRLEDAVVEALDFGGNVLWSDTITGAANGSVHPFTVSFSSDNELPTLDALADLTIGEDAAEQTLNLTGLTDGDSGTQPLRVTASSSNPSLIPDPTVTYTSPNATGSLAFTPAPGQSGTATITVTVEDGGVDNDLNTTADNATFSRTFDVTVTPAGVTAVRVRLTDKEFLQLQEVEVFERGTGTALDDSGTASQSSTYNANTGAEKAIDGDTAAGYPSSLALTRKELGAWWQVDLSGGFDVETIVVYNRSTAGDRLEGAVVEALDFEGNVLWFDTITGAANGSVHTFTVDQSADSGADEPAEQLVSSADKAPVAASGSGWMSFVDDDRTAEDQATDVPKSPAQTTPVTTPDAAWISFVDDSRADEQDERDAPRPIAIGAAVSESDESDQSSRINPGESFNRVSD